MKYRLYRKLGQIEYKDIEAVSREDAENHYTDPIDDKWKVISKGLIIDYVATNDTKTEKHDIFNEVKLDQ